ncbi:MAG TPA: alkaline phosphatase family protein, partial [Gemmataceae bacterium]|nr:alkaline phosphatase family protein [Gemmataceae bacterium]
MSRKPSRRTFLKAAAGTAAVAAAGAAYWAGGRRSAPKSIGKKVIVIGIDGMDPRLCEVMMEAGDLPNLARLRASGGFGALGTSIPPQSPVAWANFINGAGPGSHGIFDFIHRDPHQQCRAVNSLTEMVPGEGAWEVGDYRLPLDFWPFDHKPPAPRLRRQGVPFWDFLDAAGVPTTFYDLPSNYPPSPSQHGHHRCLCGMGTPDMLGTYGVFQYFSEDCPEGGIDTGSGKQSRLTFDEETARASLVGPDNSFLKSPRPLTVPFEVHRDRAADAAVIELLGQKILLRTGEWSRWTRINFAVGLPWFLPDGELPGICRFYLQSVAPPFRLYVSPINMDPA